MVSELLQMDNLGRGVVGDRLNCSPRDRHSGGGGKGKQGRENR